RAENGEHMDPDDLAVFAEAAHGDGPGDGARIGPGGGGNVPETAGSIKGYLLGLLCLSWTLSRACGDMTAGGTGTALRHLLARIVGLPVAPLTHQLFELGVATLRQHDAHRGQEIAGALLGGETLAPQPERAARIGAGGNRELDRAIKGRHPHLAAEPRLIE